MRIKLKKYCFLLLLPMLPLAGNTQTNALPEGFVYVKNLIPEVILEMRYAGNNNFIGTPITGYKAPEAILTRPAAEALILVQQELKEKGYKLKIFDAYRPQRAVNEFVTWAGREEDTLMKPRFYPEVDKKDLFSLGYISSRSGHSRGSTVDLTLVDAGNEKPVDMGGTYDFFGEISHHTTEKITEKQHENRELLKNTMSKHGFRPYPKEWWHYTYRLEPFPDTYFDFVVE